jgi:hypothetical protein
VVPCIGVITLEDTWGGLQDDLGLRRAAPGLARPLAQQRLRYRADGLIAEFPGHCIGRNPELPQVSRKLNSPFLQMRLADVQPLALLAPGLENDVDVRVGVLGVQRTRIGAGDRNRTYDLRITNLPPAPLRVHSGP